MEDYLLSIVRIYLRKFAHVAHMLATYRYPLSLISSRLPTRTHLINTPQPQRRLSVGTITTTPSHGQQLPERRGIGALGALVTPLRHRKQSAPSSSLPALPLPPPQRSWKLWLLHLPSLYCLNPYHSI
jgi:hypothetical protein